MYIDVPFNSFPDVGLSEEYVTYLCSGGGHGVVIVFF